MDTLNREALKEIMASSDGLCVTIMLPVQSNGDPRLMPLRIKQSLSQAEAKLAELELDAGAMRELLEPLRAMAENGMDVNGDTQGVVLFCAPDLLRAFRVSMPLEESVTVAEHFYVRPLLKMLHHTEKRFFLLALSQGHVRLLECTTSTSREVPLPGLLGTSMNEALATDPSDHTLAQHSGPANSSGERSGASFGTGDEDRNVKENMHQFCSRIDSSIREVLRDENAPLIVACVDYEWPIYRHANTYTHLVDEHVSGSPDGLKGGEMHKRALDVLEGHLRKNIDKTASLYEKMAGSEKASSTLRDVLRAAQEGRVMTLFVSDGAVIYGLFDEDMRKTYPHRRQKVGDEDLINVAALQTVLHGGDVYLLPAEQVPLQAPVAALFRY